MWCELKRNVLGSDPTRALAAEVAGDGLPLQAATRRTMELTTTTRPQSDACNVGNIAVTR